MLSFTLFYISGVHENPELIWNNEAREKVSRIVKQMKDK